MMEEWCTRVTSGEKVQVHRRGSRFVWELDLLTHPSVCLAIPLTPPNDSVTETTFSYLITRLLHLCRLSCNGKTRQYAA